MRRATAPRRTTAVLWLAGLAVTLVLAAVVSTFGSSQPDGLERVAAAEGLLDDARAHPLGASPLADYRADGVGGGGRVSAGIAGASGVLVTLAVGGGTLWALRRGGRTRRGTPSGDG